jgi:hypothetical protein
MPLIKPRTRGRQLVKHRRRLDRVNTDPLSAYAHFLGESTEYVLNQVIDTVLARTRSSCSGGSFVPRAQVVYYVGSRRAPGGSRGSTS